jgi:hypothetical protein
LIDLFIFSLIYLFFCGFQVRAPSAALLDHDPDMLAAFEDPDYPPPPDDEELPPPTPSDWTNSRVGTRAHFFAFFFFF